MTSTRFPFAVRLVGFSPEETHAFAAAFESEQGKGYGYFHLAEDNLQDPDLYVVNGAEVKSSYIMSQLPPSDVRPVLMVGNAPIDLPYSKVARPLNWPKVFVALDMLIERRADALSRLEASDIVTVPERRRRERLDPAEDKTKFLHLRRRLPTEGGILIVDKNSTFSDYVAEMMLRFQIQVAWGDDEAKAVEFCRHKPVAVAIINTSTPNVDPYRLCDEIRKQSCIENTIVIFLVSKPFVYDPVQAREVGASGFLNKPLSSQHLLSVLKKFVPGMVR